MWENFLILERMKLFANKNQELVNYNFWRSYDGAEVDYVEKSYTDALSAYEFKYQGNTLSKGAYSFTNAYQTKVQLINIDNYLEFLTGKKV